MKIDLLNVIDACVFVYGAVAAIGHACNGNYTRAWINIGALVIFIGMKFWYFPRKKKGGQ